VLRAAEREPTLQYATFSHTNAVDAADGAVLRGSGPGIGEGLLDTDHRTASGR
jgi:hypothetical protein